MDILYPAVVEPEEGGGLFLRFVDLENTYTDRLTLDEALFNGAEALSAMLGLMLDENKPMSGAGLGMTTGIIQRRLPCS